jgi:hypothetical protein
MNDQTQTVRTVELTAKYLDALRKAVGLQIDPETAEVFWTYAQVMDPYGDDPNLPEEYECVGRAYFARSPKPDVWVEFSDLSDATRDRCRSQPPSTLTAACAALTLREAAAALPYAQPSWQKKRKS